MSTESSLLRFYLSLHGRSVCCPCCRVFLTDKAHSVASRNPPQLCSQCCICHLHRPRLILGLAAQVKVNVVITEGVARFQSCSTFYLSKQSSGVNLVAGSGWAACCSGPFRTAPACTNGSIHAAQGTGLQQQIQSAQCH